MTGLLTVMGGLLAFAEPVAAHAVRAPNVVYILADDFGYGDVGIYNPKSKIPTPNIDRLATEGMRFTDAHSGSAVCTPTRYGILTGRYAWRTRLRRGVLNPYDPPLIAAERMTVPALFQRHGYSTACIGKWHLGWNWPMADGKPSFDGPIPDGPTTRGFDTYFGTDVPNYPPYCFLRNDRTQGQLTAMKTASNLDGRAGPMLPNWKFEEILPTLTTKAGEYLAERGADRKRFFLYVPLTSPHEPIAPSARFQGKSGISPLADFMMETDWAVGEVLSALKKNGLADNTLVIFTCDNGHAPYTGLPALTKAGHSVSGSLRGLKGDIYEGGHRVPFVARWPGVIKPDSICRELIGLNDLMATSAAILGYNLPSGVGSDSVSILPLLRGEAPATPEVRAVVHQAVNGTLAIRKGKWKLIVTGTMEQPADELYDLEADLGEKVNVAADHPKVVAQLTALLETTITSGRSTPGPRQMNDVMIPLRLPPLPKKK